MLSSQLGSASSTPHAPLRATQGSGVCTKFSFLEKVSGRRDRTEFTLISISQVL